MDSKTKILIGIIIIGLVLISGWWIWSSFYKCSDITPQFCDKGCNVDSECYPAPCGCINVEQRCLSDLVWVVAPFSCRCINNTYEVVEYKKITISTDKTAYAPDEFVTASIANNLNETVWYVRYCAQPPLQILKYENGEWNEVHKILVAECAFSYWFEKIEPREIKKLIISIMDCLKVAVDIKSD